MFDETELYGRLYQRYNIRAELEIGNVLDGYFSGKLGRGLTKMLSLNGQECSDIQYTETAISSFTPNPCVNQKCRCCVC
jgi:hypothetical protein